MESNRFTIAVEPGATIKEQLANHSMTLVKFAERMAMSEEQVNRLIDGDILLTHDIAVRLEGVFGIPFSFWENLESIYRTKLKMIENSSDTDCEIIDGVNVKFITDDMPWIVRSVTPQEDWTLLLRFDDGKEGVYDMLPWIEQDKFFYHLRDKQLFMQAFIDVGSVCWDDLIGIAPEELYENCMSLKEYEQRCSSRQEG